MPKGFLPSQDTGLISAVSEAGTEVSFAQMQRLQDQVEAAIKKDPDVTGVVSVLGVSRMNPTPNAGRLAITLRPRDERRASADDIVGRLKRAVAPIPGMTVYFQPVQDIQISTRPSRAQYQYTLVGTDAGEVIEWSDKLADAAAAGSGGCSTSPPRRRRAACACRSRSTAKPPAGSASRCRRSTTRSTTPSASGRFRRSIRRPTSIA